MTADRATDGWKVYASSRRIPTAPHIEVRLRPAVPPAPFSVHVVPFTPMGNVVVTLSEFGDWDMPGGRVEPGETAEQAARRELMEEAGFRLDTSIKLFATLFARWHDEDDDVAVTGWRPVAIGWACGSVVASPGNPVGEVAMVEVFEGPVQAACDRLDAAGRPELAFCYQQASRRYQGSNRSREPR